MLPTLTVAVFLLVTTGVFLILHRSLLRVALGLTCLSHAVNLLLMASGRWGSHPPIAVPGLRTEQLGDPVPQAFVLTAIVISMAFTLYLLAAMAVQARRGGSTELVAAPESDPERPATELRAELEGREADA